MAHAWKACWVKALGGSNPPSSAKRVNEPSSAKGFFELIYRWPSPEPEVPTDGVSPDSEMEDSTVNGFSCRGLEPLCGSQSPAELYFNVTVPPASSRVALAFSALSLLAPSSTTPGAPSTRALASPNPRLVSALTSLIT